MLSRFPVLRRVRSIPQKCIAHRSSGLELANPQLRGQRSRRWRPLPPKRVGFIHRIARYVFNPPVKAYFRFCTAIFALVRIFPQKAICLGHHNLCYLTWLAMHHIDFIVKFVTDKKYVGNCVIFISHNESYSCTTGSEYRFVTPHHKIGRKLAATIKLRHIPQMQTSEAENLSIYGCYDDTRLSAAWSRSCHCPETGAAPLAGSPELNKRKRSSATAAMATRDLP